jgi:hypothetical protein
MFSIEDTTMIVKFRTATTGLLFYSPGVKFGSFSCMYCT